MALILAAKTIFQQDSGLGVPFGVVFLLVTIATFIVRSLNGGGEQKPVDRQRPVPEPHKVIGSYGKTGASAAYDGRRAVREADDEARSRRAAAQVTRVRRKTGEDFVQLINETAERLGRTPADVAQMIGEGMNMSYRVEDGKVHLTEGQLDVLKPHMKRLKAFCEKMEGD